MDDRKDYIDLRESADNGPPPHVYALPRRKTKSKQNKLARQKQGSAKAHQPPMRRVCLKKADPIKAWQQRLVTQPCYKLSKSQNSQQI